MKSQLHVSMVNTYANCGELFRRVYILGERKPPGISAIVGTSNHVAHAADLKSVMENGVALGNTDDMVRDTLNHLWDEGVYIAPDEREGAEKRLRGAAVDKAVRMNVARHSDLVPMIRPTALSRKWVLTLEGYPFDLAGEIDIEEAGVIRDLKTTSGYPPQTAADNSLQLTMYAMARKYTMGALPDKVTLDFVCDPKRKEPKAFVKVQESVRTEEHCEALLTRIATFNEAVQKGIFMPCSPDHWLCTPKWCGFFETCPYARGRRVFPSAGGDE